MRAVSTHKHRVVETSMTEAIRALRVDHLGLLSEEELAGIDTYLHGEDGYAIDGR
jgi:hypothetical protein